MINVFKKNKGRDPLCSDCTWHDGGIQCSVNPGQPEIRQQSSNACRLFYPKKDIEDDEMLEVEDFVGVSFRCFGHPVTSEVKTEYYLFYPRDSEVMMDFINPPPSCNRQRVSYSKRKIIEIGFKEKEISGSSVKFYHKVNIR